MTHITFRLTAKNRDQLQNPTLGNLVWASFFTIVDEQVGTCVDNRQIGSSPADEFHSFHQRSKSNQKLFNRIVNKPEHCLHFVLFTTAREQSVTD